MIPRILVRCVPEETSSVVEDAWAHACHLHAGWTHRTYRDPIDPADFPLTRGAWSRCTSGAQLAGLVRLEALLAHGGIYLDSDYELYRRLDSLLTLDAFAAWEDRNTIPDAVIGARPDHPAIRYALELAVSRVHLGAWQSGPGATTEAFRNRSDVLLFPPASFYPYHYSQKERRHERFSDDPWCFGAHHWAGSWVA